jgi:hypothetical protein
MAPKFQAQPKVTKLKLVVREDGRVRMTSISGSILKTKQRIPKSAISPISRSLMMPFHWSQKTSLYPTSPFRCGPAPRGNFGLYHGAIRF